MSSNSPTSQSTRAQQMGSSTINVSAVAPSEIKSILLADGWHEISNCEYTQFAVAPASSPANPNKVYPAIEFTDRNSGKSITVPLSQVLAFESK